MATKQQCDEFYKAAIEAGFKDNGEPGDARRCLSLSFLQPRDKVTSVLSLFRLQASVPQELLRRICP